MALWSAMSLVQRTGCPRSPVGSLFGGCRQAIHAVLGGIVIAAIDNGMGLQGAVAGRSSPQAR